MRGGGGGGLELPGAPEVSWANSFRFPYSILIKIKKRWKMLMELTGPIPLHFFIKSLLKVNGKCSWGFLCQLFNLDFEKLEHSNRGFLWGGPDHLYSHTILSKELSSEAINWIFSLSGFTKVDFFIVIYSLFENHLQKHFVKGTLLDDHLQNA